jgi:urease accessory protein
VSGPGDAVLAVAAAPGGRLRYETLRSSRLVALRPTSEGCYLVGRAATPLGGDEHHLDVRIGAGASLLVRSAAAAIARRGPGSRPSRSRITVTLGPDAILHWDPQPSVAAAGCDHGLVVRCRLARGARLVWSDVVVLGRAGEEPGRWTSSVRIERDGRALVHQDLVVHPDRPGWDGPAGTGGWKVLGSRISIGGPGGDPTTLRRPRAWAARLPVAGGEGVVVSGAASDTLALAELWRELDMGECCADTS